MSEFIQLIGGQLAAQSWLEFIAMILALAYVYLAARQNIWCWPCAFFSTGIYIWLFWQVSLPFHTILNVYYLFMAVYGWMKWQGKAQSNLTVVTWVLPKHLTWIAMLTFLALCLSLISTSFFDPKYVYLDAFISIFSVFTTVLVAHKVLENWLYWIVINSFSSYLYFSKELYWTCCLFAIYVIFAIYGYRHWRKFA